MLKQTRLAYPFSAIVEQNMQRDMIYHAFFICESFP